MIGKHLGKLRREAQFLLEHKWSLVKPADAFAINKSLLKKYLPDDAVIIDCGAHIGSDSVQLARLFPRGKIHCFEPVPHLFSKLLKNTTKHKNITCHNIALGASDVDSIMHISSGASDGSSSLLIPSGHLKTHPGVYFNDQITVKTVMLDSWARQQGITYVDFLWLDMQGFEYNMLNASKEILKTIKVIYTEISLKETYEDVMLYPEFSLWLAHQGFHVVKEIIPPGADMGNALYVRNAAT